MTQVTESRSGPFFEAHSSHPGAVRDHNEDAFLARGGEGLWVVADGMGGLDDGQWAARTLARQLAVAPLSGDLERDAATVAEVVRHANFVIFKESTERQNHIGSTVVALLVRGAGFAVVWAGDSRLYLRRDGALAQVTTDHTQVQQLVDAGYLTPREAADHPMSHVLSRAVGTQAEVEAQTLIGEVRAGDLFLLCSDGLPRVLEDEEIAKELESGNPSAMIRRLVDLAVERGAPDNVTVLVIGCVDPSAASAVAMTASVPIFGGAADDDAAPPLPVAAAVAEQARASAARKGGAAAAMVGVFIAALVVAALGIGAWLLLPRLQHAAPASQVVVVQGAVPQTGLRQFEAALGGVDCSWLQIQKIAPGPTGIDLAISGVAASPAAVQSALQATATNAKLPVADIDLQSIAPPPPSLCSTLDAMRPFRAATSQTGQNLTAAQDSFAVMKQADGKEAGRAIINVTPPPQGDFALAELGADNGLSLVAPDRQTFQTLASAGAVVSKVPDAGGYRLQADYAKPGWSSVLLITGQGPFPKPLLTQPAGPRSPAWADQFASAARAGGWRVEMAWYEITSGGDLSVIPQTQAPSVNAPAINALIAASKAPPKKPAATNATATNATNAAVSAPTNAAAPSGKAAPPPAAKGATNATKSDIPL
jgi:serine/threonine-protein phosphatase Stp1